MVNWSSSTPSGIDLILLDERSTESKLFKLDKATGNVDIWLRLASNSLKFFSFDRDFGKAFSRLPQMTSVSSFISWPISSGSWVSRFIFMLRVLSALKFAIHLGTEVILLSDRSRFLRFLLTFCNSSGNSSSFCKHLKEIQPTYIFTKASNALIYGPFPGRPMHQSSRLFLGGLLAIPAYYPFSHSITGQG